MSKSRHLFTSCVWARRTLAALCEGRCQKTRHVFTRCFVARRTLAVLCEGRIEKPTMFLLVVFCGLAAWAGCLGWYVVVIPGLAGCGLAVWAGCLGLGAAHPLSTS